MQTCHLLGYMMGFSTNSDQRSLKAFTSQRHTALARQDTENLLMTDKPPALGIWRQTEIWFLTSHFICRDSAPLGTAIWIPKHKTGPPNCTRLNVNSTALSRDTDQLPVPARAQLASAVSHQRHRNRWLWQCLNVRRVIMSFIKITAKLLKFNQ